MSDAFNVTASYDKPAYNGGDTIKVTISGNDVQTTTQISQIGPLIIPLVAAVDGAKTTITTSAEQATVTVATPESVTIDPSVAIVDTSPNPRVWTLSADKLSISSVA